MAKAVLNHWNLICEKILAQNSTPPYAAQSHVKYFASAKPSIF
jgi:hypothetical protein